MLFFSIHTLIKQGLTNLIFILLLSCAAFAQTGTLQGKIVEKFAGSTDPIIGAIIRIEGTSKSSVTDTAGAFIIENIDPGTYSIQISYIGSAPKTETNIMIEAGKTTRLNPINLQEDTKVTDEVIITGTRQTGTEMSVINEVKKLDVVASAIGSEQIKRTLDRDAADVARRVSGVTVVDNRFIIVRGLSERYNTVMLNGAIAPSFEQDVKSFSLDNLQSQYIDRMIIYKSPSADLPGDFSGGVVKIYTPGMPAKNFFNVGFSSSVRQGTTFHNFQNLARGKYANYGYDDGSYGLPQDLPPDFIVAGGNNTADVYDKTKIGKLFRNDTWVPNQVKADPDIRLNLQGGYRLKLTNEKILGVLVGVNYSNTYVNISEGRRALFGPTGTISETGGIKNFYASQMDIQERSSRVGGIANLILQLNNKNTVELKNTYCHNGNTRYRNFYTVYSPNPKDFYNKPLNNVATNEINLYNTFAGMISSQLSGKHSLQKNIEFNWQTGYAKAERNEPDIKSYDYSYDKNGYAWSSYTSPTPIQLGRSFFKTTEDIKTVSGDITKKTIFDMFGETELSVKAGWYLEEKRRQFQLRGYGYGNKVPITVASGEFYNDIDINSITPNNLNSETSWDNPKGLVITPAGKAGSYLALAQTNALFLMPKIEWREKLKVTAGMRLENYSLNINNSKLIKQNWLPSINASYNLTSKIILRGSYGKTINRPELREAAATEVFDYYLLRYVQGNPNIKITDVNNYDLKLEYYFSPDEFISIGTFYKYFQNPIERVILNRLGDLDTQEGLMYITYVNADFAISKGLEFETRKSLRNLLVSSKRDWLKNIALFCNASLISSNIKYDREKLSGSDIQGKENIPGLYGKNKDGTSNRQLDNLIGNGNRRMFGQSPYIVNGGITYNNDKTKSTLSLIYNVVGNRLAYLIPGAGSIYEVPRHVIDFTYIQQIGKHLELKIGVQDILNQKIQFVQDINNDGKVKRIQGSGYATDPTDLRNIQYTKNSESFYLGDIPANANQEQKDSYTYNMKDTEFMGFKRGSYYTLGLTVKF